MSRVQKAIARLTTLPPPSDLAWDDLVRVLKHFGYRQLNGRGSRRKFFHEGRDALICCHEPHPSPNVDKGCIAAVVAHLREHRFI